MSSTKTAKPRPKAPTASERPAPNALTSDPTLVRLDDDVDFQSAANPRKALRPNEFIVTTGSNSICFTSGVNITLDAVIDDAQKLYHGAADNFRTVDMAEDPTKTFADMVDADGGVGTIGDWADLVIWAAGGRVLAVLVPNTDGSGYHVTKFNRDRSRPGPITPAAAPRSKS